MQYFGIRVWGSISLTAKQKITAKGIELSEDSRKERLEYVPFDGGYIHEEDFEYIREHNLTAIECAKYTDGWYSCLPFASLFKIFNPDELNQNYLSILHQSMFARVSNKEYIGNWYNMIGYIPEYLLMCEVDVDWQELFEIFKFFLHVSLIYFPYDEKC